MTHLSFRLQCDGNDEQSFSEDEAFKKYVFQRNLESTFYEVAKNNIENGVQLETMAFLVGIELDGIYHSTEIVFPNQNSSSDMVEDIGK